MSHDALRHHIALWCVYKAARLVDAGAAATPGRGLLLLGVKSEQYEGLHKRREARLKCTDLYECSIYLWPRAIILFFYWIVLLIHFFISWQCGKMNCFMRCTLFRFLYHSIMDKYRLPYILYWIWFPMVFYRKYILYIYEIYETAPL